MTKKRSPGTMHPMTPGWLGRMKERRHGPRHWTAWVTQTSVFPPVFSKPIAKRRP